jgi:glycosyltransferase involved in cell wall biosynthesis
MKLLHIVPSYLPAVRYGGPIQSVHGLCAALAARGHAVEVFTTNVDGKGESDVPLGVPVERDGVKVWYFPVPALRRLYWSPALGAALQERARGFDLVHTHSVFLWPTWAAARAARARGVPYVVSPRGMLVDALIRKKNPYAKRAWIALAERRNLAGAALVHFTSRLEAKEAAYLSLPVRRSCVIPNGLGAESFARARDGAPGPRDAFLLFLGRISWKKGLDRLIAALARIPDCRLVIAGDDDENLRPGLEAQAAAAGVGDRVAFVGPAYGEQKAALLRRSLLTVLPSYSENFGNVVLESLAAGCPVVVTPEVGAADVVRESGGGAVLDGAPAALGAGIRALIADPAALERMGAAGREFVEAHFGWPLVAGQMERAYRDAAQGIPCA